MEIPKNKIIKIPPYFGTKAGNEALRPLKVRGV
jgi:hypothetical protein